MERHGISEETPVDTDAAYFDKSVDSVPLVEMKEGEHSMPIGGNPDEDIPDEGPRVSE